MNIDIRRTPPAPLESIPFDIPRPFETALDNGLRVILFEDDRLPLISYRLAFNVGDVNDPDDARGITSAMAAMLTEGTTDHTSRQLAEKIERLGANISVNSSDDFTIVSASSLSLYRTEILRLVSEIVLTPTFPEEELNLYRRNSLEHLKFQRSQPNFLAGEQAARLVYGSHPYSRISPRPEDVEALDREALRRYHAETFIPNNAILIVVGAIDRDALLDEMEELFGGWNSGALPAADFPALPGRDSRGLTVVDRPGSAQSNIVITNLGFSRTDPDYFAALVMNQVLGAGASSRVFMNLREEKGFTYGAYTRLGLKRMAGDFEATAEVRTEVTGASLTEFFYELDRIRNEDVSEEELADAKSFLTGVFPLRAETQEGLTTLIVNQYLYGLPDDYLQTYRQKVDEITVDDVRRVANLHVRPDQAAIIIVGDAEEVLPQARPFADSIEIFDTLGNTQEEAKYVIGNESPAMDLAGKWSLNIDFQGQNLPVTLTLQQNGDELTGELETMLGNGQIANGKVSGSKLTATAQAEMQGTPIEFSISGKADGNEMNGTMTAPMVPEPLSFSGSRAQ